MLNFHVLLDIYIKFWQFTGEQNKYIRYISLDHPIQSPSFHVCTAVLLLQAKFISSSNFWRWALSSWSMLKANHERILQESNDHLLRIRCSELSYYSNFYQTIMTQSILVIGMAIISVTQVKTDLYANKFLLRHFFWLVVEVYLIVLLQ